MILVIRRVLNFCRDPASGTIRVRIAECAIFTKSELMGMRRFTKRDPKILMEKPCLVVSIRSSLMVPR